MPEATESVTRRVVSIFVASIIGSALVVVAPTSALAQTEKLSAAKYAETVCGPLSEAKKADDAIVLRFSRGPGAANFGPSQPAAVDVITEYQKVWADAAATLEATTPKVRDGEKIGQAFVAYATKAVDEIQKAIDAFLAVDPASPPYTRALNSFGYAGGVSIRPGLGDPLQKVTDRNVRRAFKGEPTCAGLFASLAGGPVTEFPVPSPIPFEITAGPDGNLWFTEQITSQLGKIDPKTGKVTEFPVPTAVSTITAGPDGNLWFTERDPNQIGPFSSSTVTLQLGKIDPKTGKVTEFPIPIARARPTGIAAGPDGNLWFSERTGNQIGKIDPETGVITMFPVPTANAQPEKITAGPDGNLWFTEQPVNQIARLDPATGMVTEFPIPTSNAAPFGITAGADGNVWFTEVGGNQIGKIDPATGVVTEFPIPTAAAGLFGITAGCDGNVWFTENNANKIGKIDPGTGKVTELSAPTANSQPSWITSGPDGNIWFTEEIAKQIGKLDLGKKRNGKTSKACRKAPKP